MNKKYFDKDGTPLDFIEINGGVTIRSSTQQNDPATYFPQCEFTGMTWEKVAKLLNDTCTPLRFYTFNNTDKTGNAVLGFNKTLGTINNEDFVGAYGFNVGHIPGQNTFSVSFKNSFDNSYSNSYKSDEPTWVIGWSYRDYAVMVHTTGDDNYTILYCSVSSTVTSSKITYGIPYYMIAVSGKWGSYTIDNTITYNQRELDITDNIGSGGGYGEGDNPHDNISVPVLPTLDPTITGNMLYSLTNEKMKAFTNWLWTSDWQDNIKKLRTDPMQNIIGISIIDYPIESIRAGVIFVGNVSSNIVSNVITNGFLEVDCGSIDLKEYYGTFADYEPFCATTLYLPKVGFVQIPADVCINNNIRIVYHCELSSGEGLCYVILTSTRDNVTYIWNTYTCHITSNVTLSAQDHTQQLTALSTAIINAGIAATGAIVAPQTAPMAIGSIVSNCLNVATTKNPTQTKGNIGNMSAIMCYKKPYLLINRTNLAKPSSFQENNGYLINYTAKIQGHTGFLKTRDYHCEFNAPYNHRAEIERLLDLGVIIND